MPDMTGRFELHFIGREKANAMRRSAVTCRWYAASIDLHEVERDDEHGKANLIGGRVVGAVPLAPGNVMRVLELDAGVLFLDITSTFGIQALVVVL
jgi:hypothetical protein